ncbi:MAG: M20/M25/M40 family metallo-hydrolase [Planctomycetota bacterium]|jgi:glutamate carboxypeptidase
MPTLEANRVRDFLDDRRQEMCDLLEQLIQAESPSTEPDAQQAILEILTEAFAAREFLVRRVRGRRTGGLLLARPEQRRRQLGHQVLLGHCDTAWPRGTLAEMPVSVAGNELRGPGAYDMKGGLVQGLFAVQALHAFGNDPEVTPVFLVHSDEEIGSVESTRHVRRVAAGADRVFVLEPSMGLSGKLKTARKGTGRFTVRVKGRAAGARRNPGRGPGRDARAVDELCEVVRQLFALNDFEHGVSVNVGTIDSGLRPNVVTPDARAVVDVRVPTHTDAARLEQTILGLTASTPGTVLEITGGIDRPPLEKTPDNRRLFDLARIAADQLGIALDEATAAAGSAGNVASQLAPTLDGLGAVGEGAHASEEFVLLDKMVERTALLALLLDFPPLSAIYSLSLPTSERASDQYPNRAMIEPPQKTVP